MSRWQVRYAPRALKALRKLDEPVAQRLVDVGHRSKIYG